MNEALKANKSINKNYAKKYMERHQTLCVTLDKQKDSDIIGWLDKQENRSEAVRSLIKGAIHEENYESKDTILDGDQENGSSEEANSFDIFEI